MISGRYRTESLARFWTDNGNGFCLAHTCDHVVGDLEHLLLHCPALQIARSNLEQMWLAKSASIPPLQSKIKHVLSSPPAQRMIFLLDPTSIPAIISLHQSYVAAVLDIVFFMTRTYAYALHRKKLILIGKWPYSTKNENFCPNSSENPNSIIVAVPKEVSDALPLASSSGGQPLSLTSSLSLTSDSTSVCHCDQQFNLVQQSDLPICHGVAIHHQSLNDQPADRDGCHHGVCGLTGGGAMLVGGDSLMPITI